MESNLQVAETHAYPEQTLVRNNSGWWHLEACHVARQDIIRANGYHKAVVSVPRRDWPVAGVIGCPSCRRVLNELYGDDAPTMLGKTPEGYRPT